MDGLTRLPKRVSPRLGGAPVTGTDTGYPWADGDILYAADLNAAFDRVGENVSHDVGRNLLHNPLFNVAQRGNGTWTTAGYTADRWIVNLAGCTVTSLISPMADADRAAIGDEAAVSALQSAVTGTAGANDYAMMAQRIEGARRLSGKTVTLSFWARASSGTPKIGYELYQSFGGGGSPSADVGGIGSGATAALSATWTRYTVTIAVPSTTGKTFGTNNNDWTGAHLWLSAGASLNARAGGIGVQSGTFLIWGVQLEIGTQATPLEKLDPRYDLANCQRFFQTVTFYLAAYNVAGNGIYQLITLPVNMRATPTIGVGSGTVTNASGQSVAALGVNSALAQATIVATGQGFFNGQAVCSADL
jgi:hypothetical protein